MLKTFIILILSVPALLVNPGVAQGEVFDAAQPNPKISELEQQITEMQKKHDEQINVLKQQMDELAAEVGNWKEELGLAVQNTRAYEFCLIWRLTLEILLNIHLSNDVTCVGRLSARQSSLVE